MIRTVVFIFAIALANLALGQARPDGANLPNQKPVHEVTAKPTTGQLAPLPPSLSTIPAGKCCKVNVAYPSSNETILSKAKRTCINNAIPGLTPEECAKNTCKIQIFDDKGKPILRGWNIVLDKNNDPTIDLVALPKGKYKIRFISGAKKADKALDL